MARPAFKTLLFESLKSQASYADEVINIYLLRPLAAVIVWILYPTKISPNQVTGAAILLGCGAALIYSHDTPLTTALGGTLVVLKDILDDADGQLARARQQYSRRGRFLDSVGDFIVNVAVFASLTLLVYQISPGGRSIALGFLCLLGLTLRVSYHVYYQVSFLHGENRYHLNRLIETITDEDRKSDPITLNLQRAFIVIYLWQDVLMDRIDRWSMGKNIDTEYLPVWYGDRLGLRISGLMGFGTEFMLLAICSWTNHIPLYFILNFVVMNGIWIGSILYRRLILSPNIPRKD